MKRLVDATSRDDLLLTSAILFLPNVPLEKPARLLRVVCAPGLCSGHSFARPPAFLSAAESAHVRVCFDRGWIPYGDRPGQTANDRQDSGWAEHFRFARADEAQ